jgi:hypothetical protein
VAANQTVPIYRAQLQKLRPTGGVVGQLTSAAAAQTVAEPVFLAPAAIQKLNLSSRETERALGSSRLFKRLRFHGWLQPLFKSRDQLYPWTRIIAVQRRLEAGEMPGLLPCEQRERERRSTQLKSA